MQIKIDNNSITLFCKKWRISEFSLFGSVLRDDFSPSSDIDVLAAFEPNHGWGIFDVVDMIDELRSLLGRKVDLVMKDGLRNPLRREEIMRTKKIIYPINE